MTERPLITRAVPLIDLDVARDGRTVTAYAATFDDPYEVSDEHGHYIEQIHRGAFNRAIKAGVQRIVPLFNHGLTVWGTPSDRDSDPLGVVESIRAEARGLLTVTRFGTTPRNDEVLTMIKDGSITAYSFRGPIIHTSRAGNHASGLPLVTRMELGLRDYGPGTMPVNRNASIVAVRTTSMLAEEIAQLSDEERAELLQHLATPPAGDAGTGPGDHDTPPAGDPAPDPSITIQAALAAQRKRQS